MNSPSKISLISNFKKQNKQNRVNNTMIALLPIRVQLHCRSGQPMTCVPQKTETTRDRREKLDQDFGFESEYPSRDSPLNHVFVDKVVKPVQEINHPPPNHKYRESSLGVKQVKDEIEEKSKVMDTFF